ncbi:hypothetical protein ABIE44_002386 [Marmoricola sp. OAE513]|uniref:LytR C-terminal domain-containing protein n=1 Tax=Marmoricola sp. OAE513 TaxID=2817894 RepID=UPI001AE8E596
MSSRRPTRGAARDAAGVVLPTRVMVLSISAVALAGLGFIATQGNDDNGPAKVSPAATSTVPPSPTPTTPPITEGPGGPVSTPSTPKPPKPVNKGKTTVVVFNNTNIKGLAGATATRAEKAGWNIFKTDNWHGSVDASTVYYGPKMRAAAKLLAADLDITRIKASFEPMNPKMLTVILTTDYQ